MKLVRTDTSPLTRNRRRARAGARPQRRARSAWWPLYHRGRAGWLVHPVLAGAFLGLAITAHSLRADSLDLTITRRVQDWSALEGLFTAVSWLGYSPQDMVIAVLCVGALLLARFTVAACWLAASIAGAAVLDWLFKFIVARPRPSPATVHVFRHNPDFSFPSGHVVSFLALYGFLIGFAWLELRRPVPRALIIVPCAALVLLVGPSRVYLGAHWTSDVIGAYFLGAVWLSLVLQGYAGWLLRAGERNGTRR